jgi:hypothetical protein
MSLAALKKKSLLLNVFNKLNYAGFKLGCQGRFNPISSICITFAFGFAVVFYSSVVSANTMISNIKVTKIVSEVVKPSTVNIVSSSTVKLAQQVGFNLESDHVELFPFVTKESDFMADKNAQKKRSETNKARGVVYNKFHFLYFLLPLLLGVFCGGGIEAYKETTYQTIKFFKNIMRVIKIKGSINVR